MYWQLLPTSAQKRENCTITEKFARFWVNRCMKRFSCTRKKCRAVVSALWPSASRCATSSSMGWRCVAPVTACSASSWSHTRAAVRSSSPGSCAASAQSRWSSLTVWWSTRGTRSTIISKRRYATSNSARVYIFMYIWLIQWRSHGPATKMCYSYLHDMYNCSHIRGTIGLSGVKSIIADNGNQNQLNTKL